MAETDSDIVVQTPDKNDTDRPSATASGGARRDDAMDISSLESIGTIDFDGGALGPLQLKTQSDEFSHWIERRGHDDAAIDGAAFMRTLLRERVRVRHAGLDAALDDQAVAELDDGAIETLAEAIFAASGDLLRPHYIVTGEGARPRARRRKSDEPYSMAREAHETAADRLKRVLLAHVEDRRLVYRAMVNSVTGPHGSIASVHEAVAGSLTQHVASIAELGAGSHAMIENLSSSSLRSELEDLRSPSLHETLQSMMSPAHQATLDLAKKAGSFGLADAARLKAIEPYGHSGALAGHLHELSAIGTRVSEPGAIARFHELSDKAAEGAKLASGYAGGHRLIDQTAITRLTGGLPASFEPTRSAGAQIAAQLSTYGAAFEAARMSRWSDSIAGRSIEEMMRALRPAMALSAEIEKMHANARVIAAGGGALSALASGGLVGSAALAETSVKMAAMAGARDVFGSLSAVERLANRALLGGWATRPELPDRFWSEPYYRARAYRDAEVDEGLIETPADGVLDVMVSSGLNGGSRDEAGAMALVPVGPLVLALRVGDLEADVHRLITAFEKSLRAFVTRKLEAVHGREWFRQRTPGPIHGKAKDKRRIAYKDGEARAPLIEFVDVGELMEIIISGQNWGPVFEEVFNDRDTFSVSIRALNAVRRPSAHSRALDGVRLLELTCIVHRLNAQMADDGAWKLAVEADD